MVDTKYKERVEDAFVIFVPSGHNSNGEMGIKTYDGANFPDYMAQKFIEDMGNLYPYSSLTTPIGIQAGNSHITWNNLYPT